MQTKTDIISVIQLKYESLIDCLTEKGRRLWAASEALSHERVEISLVASATNLSRTTIHQGIKEIRNSPEMAKRHNRRPRGGRKKIQEKQPELVKALDSLIEPLAKGDPKKPLRWVSKSIRNLKNELVKQGFQLSHQTIVHLLEELEYSLQSNKKSLEKSSHEDRDAQFQYISNSVNKILGNSIPVISVDTKEKELVGNYKNNGQEWCKKSAPIKVQSHDSPMHI